MRSHQKLVVAAATAMFGLLATGCTPWLVTMGDSQSFYAAPTVQAALSGIDSDNIVQGEPGCGLWADPACASAAHTYDWSADVAHKLVTGTPKWVVVELGTNDALWHPAADFAGSAYTDAVRSFVALWPAASNVLWVNVPVVPVMAGNATALGNVDTVNAALDAVAASDARVSVIDLHSVFAAHVGDWFDDDGLHFNDAGRDAYAQTVCAAVVARFPDAGSCTPVTTTTGGM